MKKSWSNENKNRVSAQVCRQERNRLRQLVQDGLAEWYYPYKSPDEIDLEKGWRK